MKQKIKLTYEMEESEGIKPRLVEHSFDGELTLPELLQEFEYFVKAVGYFPPEGSLDYVKDEE